MKAIKQHEAIYTFYIDGVATSGITNGVSETVVTKG